MSKNPLLFTILWELKKDPIDWLKCTKKLQRPITRRWRYNVPAAVLFRWTEVQQTMSDIQLSMGSRSNGASKHQVPSHRPPFLWSTFQKYARVLFSSFGVKMNRCLLFFQSAGSGQQPHAATVSFHNIYYKVTQGGNCLCRKKATTKDILVDLKWVHRCVKLQVRRKKI